ncbi:hypothetical protein H634G_11090 [Metarhizium anisopliae BRIP 53293]|uniref:Uncharacterized protein n=1 Tax=Metarhizium anisopliae BRIP 53293 TaxID=1291518 RepID=A0A0D9NLZ9_METAN|nr:hypothetical protein H634G_11090 [Metarhizium anisopliae BRIP 53293]
MSDEVDRYTEQNIPKDPTIEGAKVLVAEIEDTRQEYSFCLGADNIFFTSFAAGGRSRGREYDSSSTVALRHVTEVAGGVSGVGSPLLFITTSQKPIRRCEIMLHSKEINIEEEVATNDLGLWMESPVDTLGNN